MTDREKNIAIAEWCGWLIVRVSHGALVHWSSKEWRGPNNEIGVPDYCNDLNAIHQVVSGQTEEVKHTYAVILAGTLWKPQRTRGWVDWKDTLAVSEATAIQRAEALLKTIGKWKE